MSIFICGYLVAFVITMAQTLNRCHYWLIKREDAASAGEVFITGVIVSLTPVVNVLLAIMVVMVRLPALD